MENNLKRKQVFENFNEFERIHFLRGSYTDFDSTIFEFSNNESDYEKMIEEILDRIKLRSTAIANSEHMDTLWEYFNELGLIR